MHTHTHTHTHTYTHTHTHTQGGNEEEGDEDLMQNPEFLHSVLSSLPGVNPEEALHNLEQMTEQHREQDKDKVRIYRL